MELQKETIVVEIFHNNIHAYNAVRKALLDAAIKQADNYQIKVRLIEDVEYRKAKD